MEIAHSCLKIYLIYTKHILVTLKETIQKRVATYCFHELAVCRRGTKWKKAYLMSLGNIAICLYLFVGWEFPFWAATL